MNNELSAQELADRHGVTKSAVWLWRKDGTGPKWFRKGRLKIFYKLNDVLEWEATKEGDMKK